MMKSKVVKIYLRTLKAFRRVYPAQRGETLVGYLDRVARGVEEENGKNN